MGDFVPRPIVTSSALPGRYTLEKTPTSPREGNRPSECVDRWYRLLGDDEVISMSILHRVGTEQEEREAYLRFAPWKGEKDGECPLSQDRLAELAEKEQFILTITENGYGKRSSAYEYRRTNRGGQGITNIDTSERNGGVIASFPARQGEALMLVTDQGKMIRTTVGDIRIMGRNTQGVTIFRVAEQEHVVSVAKIDESEEEDIELDAGDGHCGHRLASMDRRLRSSRDRSYLRQGSVGAGHRPVHGRRASASRAGSIAARGWFHAR